MSPRSKAILGAALAAAMIAMFGTASAVASERPTYVSVGNQARPPIGWVEFCNRTPDECVVDESQPEILPLTDELAVLLTSVNLTVNRALIPVTDQNHWGLLDLWGYPTDGMGDCEDYQLLKRRMLAERGLSRRALLMTVVIDETNAGHAVLTVRTDHGDFILDNKTDAIRPWRRTGYSFIKRAGQDGQAWVSLEGKEGAAQVATAEP